MFDRIGSGQFKRDQHGRIIFFPWGNLGKGYIVPDRQTELKIRKFIIYYYICFVIQLAFFFISGHIVYEYYILLPSAIVIWTVAIKWFTKPLIESETRLTFTEILRSAARTRNRKFLWLIVIVSFFMLAQSIYFFIKTKNVVMAISVIFFLLMTFINLYILSLKDN